MTAEGMRSLLQEPQQPDPPGISKTRAQDMHSIVYLVDCCVFALYPPPHRPLMRAKFAPSAVMFFDYVVEIHFSTLLPGLF